IPSSLVVADCARIRFGPLTVTVTPGTAAPFTSVTVPSTDPVVEVCADAPAAKSESTRASTAKNRIGVLILTIPFVVFSCLIGIKICRWFMSLGGLPLHGLGNYRATPAPAPGLEP